ncbi:MAG: PSD1 and planctomycete cytochrome C domain-containing protein [Gemmataceae bacterium]|nr:PSD1 and planctomycete cytochrome C domain-containing protein [Gemmataceae bacterium]
MSIACWLGILPFAHAQEEKPLPKIVDFNRDIRPILSDNCYLCHGPAKATRKADLRLDVEEEAFADRGGYFALVPGKLKESHLYKRVTSQEKSKQMPPPSFGRKPSPRQIELLRLWIEQGAKWQKHWSFVPPERPPLPVVKNSSWVRNSIDAFVLARMEGENLSPSPEASRETLIRRVSFDLTGMPPTIDEINAFVTDRAPDAYEKLVDRLLASPRYGERMVLEWLDAARYSDTNGYQTDGTRAMWPWRDWVIEALNKNMPFDQFTIEQIAGDMLPSPTVPQKIATGFHRNHMLNGEGGRIAEESRVDYVVDRVDTTFTIWQGLTAGCARCHEHKYDPISQKEYYGLYAYFNNIDESGGVDRRNSTAAPVLELPTDEQKTKIADREKIVQDFEKKAKALSDKLLAGQADWEKDLQLEKLPENVQKALKVDAAKRTAEQKKAISDHYLSTFPERQTLQKELEKAKKSLSDLKNSVLITMVMEERKQPRETFVLLRGVYNKYGEKVSPGLPTAFPPLLKDAPNNRLGFARWLVDKSNPLTARVTVNRIWQMFFGAGLVKTAEDFGAQGEWPSHPELLDWLAVEFMQPSVPSPQEGGEGRVREWDIKRIHKLIVMSATYRQSSQVSPASLDKDPDNRLLSRGPRFRLSPFNLRDQALALSGLLVDKIGGPPVRPYQPPGLWEDFSFNQIKYTQDKGEKLYRRSLYTFWRRSIAPPNMFDTSARQVCTVRQSRTNTPLHALILLNDVTFVEAARVWAERLMKEGGKTPEQRLHLAFRMATARHPTAVEQNVLMQGFERTLKHFQSDRTAAMKLVQTGESPRDARLDAVEQAAYAAVLNMILNLDEVVTKE